VKRRKCGFAGGIAGAESATPGVAADSPGGKASNFLFLPSRAIRTSVSLDIFTSEIVQTYAANSPAGTAWIAGGPGTGTMTRNHSLFFLPVGNWIRFHLTIG